MVRKNPNYRMTETCACGHMYGAHRVGSGKEPCLDKHCACGGFTTQEKEEKAGPDQQISMAETLALAVGRDLQVEMPATLEECAVAARRYLTEERIGGLRAACLLAYVRASIWPEKSQANEWLAWAKEVIGLSPRSCWMYLSAGEFLLSSPVAGLPQEHRLQVIGCTVVKLEQLSRIQPQLLKAFVSRNAVDVLSRDEIKERVDRWEMTEEKRKLLEDAEADRKARAERLRTPAGKIENAAREILALEEHAGETLDIADAGAAIRAGFLLQQAGLNRLEKRNDLSKAQWAELVANLEAVTEFAKTMQK